jgi:hypothetical protein
MNGFIIHDNLVFDTGIEKTGCFSIMDDCTMLVTKKNGSWTVKCMCSIWRSQNDFQEGHDSLMKIKVEIIDANMDMNICHQVRNKLKTNFNSTTDL